MIIWIEYKCWHHWMDIQKLSRVKTKTYRTWLFVYIVDFHNFMFDTAINKIHHVKWLNLCYSNLTFLQGGWSALVMGSLNDIVAFYSQNMYVYNLLCVTFIYIVGFTILIGYLRQYDQVYLCLLKAFAEWMEKRHVTICIIRYECDSLHFTLVSTGWMECPDVGITEWTYTDCQVSGGFQSSTRYPRTGRLFLKWKILNKGILYMIIHIHCWFQ